MKKASEVVEDIWTRMSPDGADYGADMELLERAIEADRVEQRREAFEEAASMAEYCLRNTDTALALDTGDEIRALAEREE